MMSRRERTRILAEGPESVAIELAALIGRGHKVDEVHPPRQGLVMCEVRETARGSRFYLGEALMTECRMRVGDTEGLGAVLGARPELARAMAVLDAALSQPFALPEAEEIERRLRRAAEDLDREAAREQGRVLASRVSFDTMEGQDMSVQAVVK